MRLSLQATDQRMSRAVKRRSQERSGAAHPLRKAPLFFPFPLALALLFLSSACDLQVDEEEIPAPQSCSSDQDCNSARREVCRLFDGTGSPSTSAIASGEGICIVQGTPTEREVWLEIRPERSTGLPQSQFGPINLGDGQNRELLLPSPAQVSGRVSYTTEEPLQPVAGARLRFRSVPLIPGRPLVFDFESEGKDERLGQISPRLLPGGIYSVQLSPPSVDESRPPPEPTQLVELEDGQSYDSLYALSPPSELIEIEGLLEIERNGQRLPAAEVEVWASEPVLDAQRDFNAAGRLQPLASAGSGANQSSGRMLSAVVRSNAEGRFSLALPRLSEGEVHRFRIQTGSRQGSEPFPAFVSSEVFEADSSSDLGPVFLGSLGASKEITLSVVDESQSPLAGARVVMRSLDPAFAYTATAETNARGLATLHVFPGTWSTGAHPPLESEWGLCRNDEALVVDEEGFQRGSGPVRSLVCPRLSLLGGHVLDHRQIKSEGQSRFVPVPKAAVEAVRRPDALFPEPIHIQGSTRHDGTFSLRVPAGEYDLSIVPPSTSKLPIKHLRSLEMEPDHRSLIVAVVLDEPFELFGNLYSGSKSTPFGGSIEAYSEDADGVVLQVGRGMAQADGRYSILLPGVAR